MTIVPEPASKPTPKPGLHRTTWKDYLIAVAASLYIVAIAWLAQISITKISFTGGFLPYLICAGGFFFFWVRQNHRFTYGVLEFVFGVALCFVDFPIITDLSPDTIIAGFPVAVLAKQFTGLYVMVRGLDNIGKALKKYPDVSPINSSRKSKFKNWWGDKFGFD